MIALGRFSANCSLLFADLPIPARPAAAREAGFDAVEFWWPFADAVPAADEVAHFTGSLRAAGVRLASLNLFGGDLPSGDRGILSWPGAADVFESNLEVALGIVEATGCSVLNVLYGRALDGVSVIEHQVTAQARLDRLVGVAQEVGASVVLEPLSGIEGYPLRRAQDVLSTIDSVGSPRGLGLLADLFHLATNGDDVEGVIRAHVGRIGHVQLADAPGRVQPGTGRLPIDKYLRILDEAGYSGGIGLEYVPDESQDRADELAWWNARRR